MWISLKFLARRTTYLCSQPVESYLNYISRILHVFGQVVSALYGSLPIFSIPSSYRNAINTKPHFPRPIFSFISLRTLTCPIRKKTINCTCAVNLVEGNYHLIRVVISNLGKLKFQLFRTDLHHISCLLETRKTVKL